MSVTAASRPGLQPDLSELLARAREIAALARVAARETEAARRVSEAMIERMRRADLFRLMQPRAYGGFEYGFDALVKDRKAVWSGVRNALAQKHLRAIEKGDRIFYYHTGDEKAVVGIARALSGVRRLNCSARLMKSTSTGR